jgi:hypothetical protein
MTLFPNPESLGAVGVHAVSRPTETRAVADLLQAVRGAQPAALLLEGEPGIGKTTLWLDALEQARALGCTVLSARTAEAESRMAYGAIADLLGGIDHLVWADLPEPQRMAVDGVLLRAGTHNDATDQRAVGAALLSVVTRLTRHAPVVLAFDDLQWVDPSSAQALGFTARRLTGPVGVLATVRSPTTFADDGAPGASWLEMPRPDALRRVQVAPLTLGALHGVLSGRIDRSFSWPALVRIHDVSRGNPLYALELARAMTRDGLDHSAPLPATLAEVVQARLADLDPDVRLLLLAAASVAGPTVDILQRVGPDGPSTAVRQLEDAERAGVVTIDGHAVRFSHPSWPPGSTPRRPPRSGGGPTSRWPRYSTSPSSRRGTWPWPRSGATRTPSRRSIAAPGWPAAGARPPPRRSC